jgi:hypothetical protein
VGNVGGGISETIITGLKVGVGPLSTPDVPIILISSSSSGISKSESAI